MAARSLLVFLSIALLSGCAVILNSPPPRLALLAPFEGRYRDIGYEALYAVRLAIADTAGNIDLLAIDDGGSAHTAIERARAITSSGGYIGALLIGPHATNTNVQMALADLPTLIIGGWGVHAAGDHVVSLSNPDIVSQLTTSLSDSITQLADTPFIGDERYALSQMTELYSDSDLIDVTIHTSGRLPSDDFNQRYLTSAEFAPEPGFLATLAYDATRLMLLAERSGVSWAELRYEGLNGVFTFANGYWQDAPVYRYIFRTGVLSLLPD